MRKELHICIINAICQNPKDRGYISATKRCLDNLSDADKEDPDIQLTINFLNRVIGENIIDRHEFLSELSLIDYSDSIKLNIDDTTRYTKKYMRTVLEAANAETLRSKLKPIVDKIQDSLTIIEYAITDTNKTVDAVRNLTTDIDDLSRVMQTYKLKDSGSNLLIMDPKSDEDENSTLRTLLDEMRSFDSNTIKTIRPIDMVVGGGFMPQSLSIFCGFPGRGKSLMLQNVAMYASKNNDISTMDIPEGMKPCILFVSLELTKQQLLSRHLNWCGVAISNGQIKNMTDAEVEELIAGANKRAGLEVPIIYSDRVNSEYGTTAMDINDEITACESMNYKPIMCVIDYVDRLDSYDSTTRRLSASGAEGSVLLRLKGRETKAVAVARKIPVVTAAQLSGEAGKVISDCERFSKQVDVLENVPQSALAGSKLLTSEVEFTIFCNKFKVEERSSDSDRINYRGFIQLCVKKDRDGRGYYEMSDRDSDNDTAYYQYTRKVKNTPGPKAYVTDSAEISVTIPTEGFRISDTDYGRSIRMFYLGSEDTEYEPFNMDGNNDDIVIDFDQEKVDKLNILENS